MNSSRIRRVRGIGAVVLVSGSIIMGWGLGVSSAANDAGNPFKAILDRLDQIQAAITGGGGQDGNHTLRWDTNNPPATRFTTAFPGAILDKNTGLVWEQAPDTTRRVWPVAPSYCANKNVGGTVGWRLPSVVELKSVQDPSLPAPFVPGSVFTGVQSTGNPLLGAYWTASSSTEVPTNSWIVNFHDGNVFFDNRANPFYTWCVRGGMNADQY
jgi:hypothetical protein